MASSLISSSHHIDLDSVFGMEDTGMVQMFESLIATGLKNFLGCPAVFSKAALTEFFANGSVSDGLVASTVNGVHVEISEKVFAEAFELPIDGLTDVSDVPKNLVFDARSLLSASQEQLTGAVLLFNVLKEMVTPGSRQAKGFAIQICAILKNVPVLVLGESRVFPASRVLTEKNIHRYVPINDKVGGEADTDAPRVKKTHVKKAVSHKRPAIDFETAPVVKKNEPPRVNLGNCTRSGATKGKPLVIAQEAVPLQIVEAAADAPVEQPPVPKRKSKKRKRRLILEDDLEINEPVAGRFTAEHPVEEATTGVQKPVPESVEQPVVVPVVAPATDDPDAVIKKVLNQLDVVSRTDDGEQPQGTVVEEIVVDAKEPHWFDLPYDDLIAKWDAEIQVKVSIQVGAAALDTVDVQREVKAMNAKVDIFSSRLDDVNKDVEATKEAISHQLLEFQSQAQANQIVLTDQLGQLFDYINRGGNAKNGEGESSRGPQPPPAIQIRDSGNAGGSGDAVRTTELTQADIDAANRQILERMMREDRERERERRSKSRSGSYKRHRY
ncbi:uridine-cytidine kinase C-like [Dorcoceras hygrometricum]|uniref:Uridine-cytidine kinase C-like n=1 Tax=Dorcoceras hygrometricum TaxID=472368 RepID=A0A2Z7BUM2_9LAMI|nr:uridine-cytidine kinase C-like [Dorcoceras hygrometricum]